MKRSSVYVKVQNPARQTDCSFGASGGFYADIRVGWGSADSHTLAQIEVREFMRDGEKVFHFLIDGELFHAAVHKDGELQWRRKRGEGVELHKPFWR